MAWPPLRSLWVVLLPALLFAGLYARALDYEFVWTDVGEIEYGTLIRPLDGLLEAFWQPMHSRLDYRTPDVKQSYYRPLQVVLVSVVAHHSGKQPRAFRIVNLMLGVATAIVFTAFAAWAFGRVGPALVAGSIFAAHPGGIEVYVWIAGLSAALADFFVVASVFAAALALATSRRAPSLCLGVVSLLSLALALASKEHAAVTPALLLALVLAMWGGRGSRPLRREWIRAGLLVGAQGLLVLAYLGLRPLVLGAAMARSPLIGGSLGSQIWSSLALWPRVVAWLLVPWQSTTSDAVRLVATPLDPGVGLGVALALGSAAAAFALWRRGHVMAAFALVWIWIAFLPTSGVVPLLHARAERNWCLSIFGVALLWPAVFALARPTLPRRSPAMAVAMAAGLSLLAVIALAQRTWARTPDWRNEIVLFQRDTAHDPLYREGRYQLALALYARNRPLEAHEALVELFDPYEGHWSYLRMANVYETLCLVNRAADRNRDTLELLEQTLLAEPQRVHSLPGFAFCGARALEEEGRVPEALDLYQRLLRETPPGSHAPFQVGIARCHARLGDRDEARAWLSRVDRARVQDRALEADIQQVRAMIRRDRGNAAGR